MNNQCNNCPRACGVDREKAVGFCGAGDKLKVARAGLHFWEEPIISGKGGSGAIFFSGCNLRCVYCQNYKVSRGYGISISAERLAEIFRELEEQGAENINLVTPTPYVKEIKQAIDLYRPRVPVVYNCGGYESVRTIDSLRGYVDIYMPDMKYADNALALKYSGAADYYEVAAEAILAMRAQVKDGFFGDVMQSGLLVRHLVLPGAVQNSLKVADWISGNLPRDTYVSIMSQYTPCGEIAALPELNRRVKALEYKAVVARIRGSGRDNVFIQDNNSAEAEFIPPFNGEGVLINK